MLSERLTGIAARDWEVECAFAENDGVETTLVRGHSAAAVVILGGEDVSPDLYGVSGPYPHESPHYRRADLAQIALVHEAVKEGTPLLGICRGIQIVNVAQGGALIRDLSEPGHRSETLLDDHVFARHDLTVDAGREFASAIRSTSVHSAHHQAVDSLGEGLVEVASGPGGVIEAIEHESAPVVAVQWHPEDPAADPAGVVALLDHLRARIPLDVAA